MGVKKILDIFFPPRCPVCDRILDAEELRGGQKIHGICRKKLFPVTQPYCFHCGRPVAEDREYCHDCARRREKAQSPYRRREPFSYIERGRSVFIYQGEMKQSMYRFKYANRREYAAFYVQEACRSCGDWLRSCGIQAVVPVPMYRKKEKRRGYNQAKLLARGIAEELNLAYEPELVLRVRDTRPQKELDDKERKNNLKSAFQAREDVVQYSCILLVDDIYTTGYTAESVAMELRRAGVGKVFLLTVCTGKGC